MDKAKTVLNLITMFDRTDRETIMENINYLMPKLAERRMMQYQKIFDVTGKSKGFVLSWFNGKVKLPLIDLCKIANLLGVNVYSLLKKNGSCYILMKENALDNILFGADVASTYIEVFEAHKAADKDTLVDALEKYYGIPEPKRFRMNRVKEKNNRLSRLFLFVLHIIGQSVQAVRHVHILYAHVLRKFEID